MGQKLRGEPYRAYSCDLQGPKNYFDDLSFVREAPSLLKHLLGDVTMAAVGALIGPNVRELSRPHESGLRLFHRDESVMLPGGCRVLNMTSPIPEVEAILGSLSSSFDE